ncbi:undecaprenyl-diphosphate phosphatase [Gluconobacter oxydans]|uniref:Undecaprenyl-diphosphatase n=1 Tax=Gluconobacter oxydans NBRC 3293 TaxID=1315969 RepID=A0A829X5V4_GLUOY|nr:undecaprenyl-diphosphate phosphatase [Gluconobacter oxydans]GEM18190.1 undecaprenyl pyrophosphate phosphatase [Gluconobacter oxydans NBRC 3293]
MTLLQALILAIVQGITEPFPVSSLGHAVLLPALLHWDLDEHAPMFLPFLTMLHVGTLVALAGVFWRDWMAILGGMFGRYGSYRQMEAIRIFGLLVIATIPAVLVGWLLEHRLRAVFGTPLAVAGFLILNGFLLMVTEWLRRQKGHRDHKPIATLAPKDAVIIGIWQCLALLPGLSRSGATMNGGLLRGLDHETAARFSLLMAQPIVLAATVREAWQMRHMTISHDIMVQCVAGAVIAGLTALICSLVMLRFFRNHDGWALTPFGVYCVLAGLFAGAVILL